MIISMSKLIYSVHFSYYFGQNRYTYKSTKISLKKQKYKQIEITEAENYFSS